ncbi:MAG: hypothetical protein H6835_06775 [Planctomycetes bacterium]|nr:hypothetical protein [Planctomycetota bacterium]
MLIRTLTVLLFGCALAVAQREPGPADAAPPAVGVAKAPERIHIIGASVSGGFEDGPLFGAEKQGDSVPLQQLLKKWCGEHCRVTTHAPMEMWKLFEDPLGVGDKEVVMARRRKPDVVLAIDFLFWFSYGYVRGDEAEARAALLQQGLALLNQLEVPLVIGDLPDMKGAATRMLSPRQVPSAEQLRQLNATIAAFDRERDDVTTLPLAAFVSEMRDKGVVLPLAAGPLQLAPLALQQEDRLHATRLGMAVLGFRMQDTLRSLFPEGHALHDQQWTFEQWVEAAGADGELELLRAKVKADEQAAEAAPAGSGK